MPSFTRTFSDVATPSSSKGLVPSLCGISPLSMRFIFELSTFCPALPISNERPFCTDSAVSDDANTPRNSAATELSRMTGAFMVLIFLNRASALHALQHLFRHPQMICLSKICFHRRPIPFEPRCFPLQRL